MKLKPVQVTDHIRRVKVDASDEMDLLTGLIVSDEFCRKVLSLVRPEHLSGMGTEKLLDWIRQYHGKRNKAPGKGAMQDIFKRNSKRLSDAEARAITSLLEYLSDRYATGPGNRDWEHAADMSVEFLRRRNLELLRDNISRLLDRDALAKAELVVQGYRVPGIGTGDLPSTGDVRRLMGSIDWIWHPWLPRGYVTMVAADPGIGKSAVALHLAGCASRAIDFWPDGQVSGSPLGDLVHQRVIWCEAESMHQTHAERADHFGIPDGLIMFFPGIEIPFRLDDPAHVAGLDEAVRKYSPVLVVADSFRFAQHQDENESHLATLLAPLQRLAQEHGLPVLLIHHLRKRPSAREIDLSDLRGSSAIAAAVRSVIILDTPDAVQPERHRMHQVKNNFARLPPPLGWQWERQDLGDGELKQYLVFDQNPPQASKGRAGAQAQAADALIKLLEDGQPRPREWIIQQLGEQAINQAAIDRAAKSLADGGLITRTRKSVGGRTIAYWQAVATDAGEADLPQGPGAI